MRRHNAINIAIGAFAVALALASPGAVAETNVLFVFDASGSMKAKVDSGETRLSIAKRSLSETLKEIPSSTRLGLILYGHRHAKDCTDIELVSPLGADDAATIAQRVNSVNAKGETPIADALRQGARSFAAFKGQKNRIVLITDGIEECKGDPCAAAQEIKNAGLDLKVDIVGFTLSAAQGKAMECVTKTTGGSYISAQDAKGLAAALAEVKQEVAESAPPPPPPPPPEPNLLSRKLGGQLVAAPNEGWAMAISGVDKDQANVGLGQEAIFSFKDDKPAMFSKFELLISGTEGSNVKDFELFAGNDSPTGTFRSLGKFTALNMRMMKSPYQEFSFPQTTAKYFKIKILSNYGGSNLRDTYLGQIRLIGQSASTGPGTAPTPAAAPATNIIAASAGGHIVPPTAAELSKVLSGKDDDYVGVQLGQEATFAFRDGKAATFSKFAVLIMQTEGGNIKDFEISAGDSATAKFKPLGKFTAQNLRLVRSPYQEFSFPPTTAKFFRIKILSNYGGSNLGSTYLEQIRLYGQLAK